MSLRERLTKVLVDNGVDSEGTMHASWRCHDKERYPAPCNCVEQMVNELIEAIAEGVRDE